MPYFVIRCDLCGQAIRRPEDRMSLTLGIVPAMLSVDDPLREVIVVVLHRFVCVEAVWSRLLRALPAAVRHGREGFVLPEGEGDVSGA